MKQILMTVVGALTIASLAEAPVAGQNREERAHMQMTAELRILLQQQQELALAVAGLSQSLAEAVKALNSRLDVINEPLMKALANQGVTIGNIGTDVRGIGERSQETITRLGEVKVELEQFRKALQQLLTSPVYAPRPVDPLDPNAPPSPDVSQAPAGVTPSVVLGMSPARLFASGNSDYSSGNYPSAIATFQQLLKEHGDSEYADDAQFFIGESEHLQGRFEQAVAAYNLVIQNYPKGDLLPDAYYKLGVAHERLGRMDSARAAWQQVMKQFPNSSAAALAKQGIGRVERSSKP